MASGRRLRLRVAMIVVLLSFHPLSEDHITGSYLTPSRLLSDTLSDTSLISKSLSHKGNRPKSMKKPDLRFRKSGRLVEAAGIAPASREASVRASTCVADRLIVGLGAPTGRVPFGLSCHEFNPCRNKRLGTGDPELASPAEALGRSPGAGPLLFLRQRDGDDQHCCRQLSFGRLFTRPADQPRHATVHFGHPVDPGSPPNRRSCERDQSIIRLPSAFVSLHVKIRRRG